MTADTANAYLRTKVLTASPAELRLLLIEGAIRFARQGREGLASRNFEASYAGLTQAKAIVLELINCLRPEVDPDLCAKLSSLYTFMYKRLIDANLEKSPEIVEEVIGLLEYERETWVMLMERLVQDSSAATGDVAAHAGAARSSERPEARAPLSIEG